MGDVDELNSALGTALTLGDDETLVRVQNELFDLGADLSVPFLEDDGRLRVTQEQIDRLEEACDEANAKLEPLKSFVLPGGTELAARLFLARAICRRAERRTLVPEDVNPRVPVYLNRLSDLLFILARAANAGEEILWKPGAS
jgi:cob(I)alamin adenosyltransferase